MLRADSIPAATEFDRRRLSFNELIALPGRHVMGLTVEMGQVWVTFDGRDYIVSAGRSLVIDTADRVLIQAISAGRTALLLQTRATVSDMLPTR